MIITQNLVDLHTCVHAVVQSLDQKPSSVGKPDRCCDSGGYSTPLLK
jgi:hypothetical protein